MSVTPRMRQLPSPSSVGYESEATLKLPGGLVYHEIHLVTNLAERGTIKRITLDIGGTPIVMDKGAILDVLDKAYQKHQAPGRFVIPLSRFEMRSPVGIYQTALATSRSDDITLKVEFGVQGATDPAVLTMRGVAEVSPNPAAALPGGGRSYIPMRYEHVQDSAAAGDHEWAFPNGRASKYVQRLLLDESNVTISAVHVKRGDQVIEKLYRSDLEYQLQDKAGVALQPGYLLIDFVKLGFGRNDAMSTQGLNFVFEVDGSGAIKTFVDGFEKVAA